LAIAQESLTNYPVIIIITIIIIIVEKFSYDDLVFCATYQL